eukprot:NODE_160_length_15021_cov_0.894786.p10 type:complete len:125 gc:universal NODE_160_length_15021_cov_0.894786:6473-6847(+)
MLFETKLMISIKGGFNQFLLRSLQRNGSKYTFNPNNDHKNVYDTLHGGVTASLVDITTSLAIYDIQKHHGVSLDLSVQFLRPVKGPITLEPVVEKLGKSIAFTSCHIYDDSHTLVAVGRHIKKI